MQLPFFYIENLPDNGEITELDEDTSRHVAGVLRMKIGEQIHLTEGRGNLFTAEIVKDHKKKCQVKLVGSEFTARQQRKLCIGISLLKNNNRLEWFLEKAAELGIAEIIPMICNRTEKQHFRKDRMQHILVSAMLQSRQVWLPVLHEPIAFEKLMRQEDIAWFSQKFIAYCGEGDKASLADLVNPSLPSQIILIGPEGDFTQEEVDMAMHHHFTAVAMGSTRLRTETAGVVAAALMQLVS
jgi:16S rRNA (uracil1498-N3)-methyltransferase